MMINNIRGFPDYMITTDGRVMSFKRSRHGRWLKPKINPSGYKNVALRKNGQTFYKRIHQLVLSTFCPTTRQNVECNHKDGNKLNNMFSNLEWVTHKQNIQHAYDNGLISRPNYQGANNPAAKLLPKHIKAIRKLKKQYTVNELGYMFNVSYATISDICRRKTWRHIK